MANPILVFNNSTGSNTTSSGAGPGDGTTSGSTLSGSVASTSLDGLTVTLPSVDLTNVLVDGSHCLWITTSTGKQFCKITGKADSGLVSANVTVDAAYTGSLTGQNYAIGGKRSNPFAGTSLHLYQDQNNNAGDARGGWKVNIQETGSDYNILVDVSIEDLGGGGHGEDYFEFFSDDATKPKILSDAAIGRLFRADYATTGHSIKFRGLEIGATSGNSPTAGYVRSRNYGNFCFENCKLQDVAGGNGKFLDTNSEATTAIFNNCEILDFPEFDSGNPGQRHKFVYFNSCYLNNVSGFAGSTDNANILTFLNNVLENCGPIVRGGTRVSHGRTSLVFQGNVVYLSSSDSIEVTTTSAGEMVLVSGNLFHSAVGTAIKYTSQVDLGIIDGNAFFNNGTDYTNRAAGTNDITLSVDPFVDAANDDYNFNDAAGGGADLRSASFNLPQISSTSVYPFRHLVSDSFGGGGGGGGDPYKVSNLMPVGSELIDA